MQDIKSTFSSISTQVQHILTHKLLQQLLLKVSWSKELKKKEIKRQMQIVAEIYQNRTAGKDQFFFQNL
jgi:hypothetical protein